MKNFNEQAIIGILLLITAIACGKANSSSKRAEVVPSPLSGYVCFVIVDDDGKTVGGNCVKD